MEVTAVINYLKNKKGDIFPKVEIKIGQFIAWLGYDEDREDHYIINIDNIFRIMESETGVDITTAEQNKIIPLSNYGMLVAIDDDQTKVVEKAEALRQKLNATKFHWGDKVHYIHEGNIRLCLITDIYYPRVWDSIGDTQYKVCFPDGQECMLEESELRALN